MTYEVMVFSFFLNKNDESFGKVFSRGFLWVMLPCQMTYSSGRQQDLTHSINRVKYVISPYILRDFEE